MIGKIEAIIAEAGFEVRVIDDHLLSVRDPDSGIAITAALEDEVFFLSLPCATVSADAISPAAMHKMLAADNGISTSSFQLYPAADDQVVITLNNYCKLQELGSDDVDDILSCLGFLLADVIQAHELLGELAERS